MAEEAKTIRRTAKTRFTRKRNELLKSISSKSNRELVESNYAQLVDAWNILESKHDLYTMYLRDDELEDADKWITESQDLFSEATTAKINFTGPAQREGLGGALAPPLFRNKRKK